MCISHNLRDIIAITTGLIGASIAAFNWRAARFRGKLKDDLDIQKRYREELEALGKTQSEIAQDEDYAHLKTKIHRKMTRAYHLQGTDWSDAAIALFFFSCAAFAWNHENPLGAYWRFVATMVSGVAGAIYAFLAVRDRGRPRE